jgi:hypothetical protein
MVIYLAAVGYIGAYPYDVNIVLKSPESLFAVRTILITLHLKAVIR